MGSDVSLIMTGMDMERDDLYNVVLPVHGGSLYQLQSILQLC